MYNFFKSFSYAFNGLRQMFFVERNFTIHVLTAIVTIVFGFLMRISTAEWMVIILCIVIVISLEIVNSAIEKLCDFIHPEEHEKIKIIKDISAAAVLIAALAAFVIGLVIFLPKILHII